MHIITNNILRYLEENSIPTDSQHGFLGRISCERHLLMLYQHLDFIDKGKQMDLGILDFCKSLILTKPNTNVFLSSWTTMIRHSGGQSSSCPTESSRLLLMVQNIDMTREHISFTFDPRDTLLYFHIFVRAAVACAILERTSGFEPTSD